MASSVTSTPPIADEMKNAVHQYPVQEDDGAAATGMMIVCNDENLSQQNHEQQQQEQVLQDLYQYLSVRNGDFLSNNQQQQQQQQQRRLLLDNTAMAIPVAAMKTLLNVVQRSKAETMMGLQHELQLASQTIIQQHQQRQQQQQQQQGRQGEDTTTVTNTSNNKYDDNMPSSYSISLQSGIELFLHYITRVYLETPNFNDCRVQVIQRGQHFQQLSYSARDRIAIVASDFILPNTTIITFGFSRAVALILFEASKTKHFDIIVVEGSSSSSPSSTGSSTAQCYRDEMDIPVTVVSEAAMGYIMEERNVSMVLVGSYVIVENGGLFNKCGTYTLAMCAHTLNIPLYVAAESYKFARLYPLHQSDIPYNDSNNSDNNENSNIQGSEDLDRGCSTGTSTPIQQQQIRNPNVDYTPAKYITLLFTDLGVLTTSAVSDELIRLYQ